MLWFIHLNQLSKSGIFMKYGKFVQILSGMLSALNHFDSNCLTFFQNIFDVKLSVCLQCSMLSLFSNFTVTADLNWF